MNLIYEHVWKSTSLCVQILKSMNEMTMVDFTSNF